MISAIKKLFSKNEKLLIEPCDKNKHCNGCSGFTTVTELTPKLQKQLLEEMNSVIRTPIDTEKVNVIFENNLNQIKQ